MILSTSMHGTFWSGLPCYCWRLKAIAVDRWLVQPMRVCSHETRAKRSHRGTGTDASTWRARRPKTERRALARALSLSGSPPSCSAARACGRSRWRGPTPPHAPLVCRAAARQAAGPAVSTRHWAAKRFECSMIDGFSYQDYISSQCY